MAVAVLARGDMRPPAFTAARSVWPQWRETRMNDFVEVGILKQMAIRVTSIAKPQKKDYQQVLKEDVLNAWQEMNQKTAEKSKMKRIGFVA